MRRRLPIVVVAFAFAALACGASGARAQLPTERVVLLGLAGEPSLAPRLALAVRALAGALGPRASVVTMEADGCWPEEPACTARYLRGTGATRLVFVRVVWERAGCVPMRGRDGTLTGHRMLRAPTLHIGVLDAHGASLAHESDIVNDLAHVASRALELATSAGLLR